MTLYYVRPVAGSRGNDYLVLPTTNFCDCEAYRFKVLRGEQTMCKHALALHIAVATAQVAATAVDDTPPS